MNEVPNRANHPNRQVGYRTPQENTFLGNARREQSAKSLRDAQMSVYSRSMTPRVPEPTQAQKDAQAARMAKPTSYGDSSTEGKALPNPYTYKETPAKKVGKVRGMINKIRGRK
jgi:hypothetical protein